MNDALVIAALLLGSPVIVVLLGGVGWVIRSRYEDFREIERRLSGDRRRIYAEILEPYILMFANLSDASRQSEVIEQITSVDYRRTAFELALIADDDVVRAYNDMMQYFYHAEDASEFDAKTGMRHFGQLLREIRRGLGNKGTDLSEWDMLRWLIKDIDRWVAN